ncbi:MAG: Asp-tRNA(Asn)/Glu-tRNA(Gln) amidotransferase subunit GatB [Bdellovibrionales bacterium]|nr:Asp-tRNA(Asn)/Glu-tRNA(Gln) amidotransferase subunit GatB [Bdellovibrionales bacterium]
MGLHKWETVIGLEIHAQLNTNTKIFSDDRAEFSHSDNKNISPVSLGFPGTLPVLNKAVVSMGVKTGLALNCKINTVSVFERKNYFYPDLAKGYQISQYQHPLCSHGVVEFYLDGEKRQVKIERAHLEEDAGKSIHQTEGTLINYNRAGVPLLEIVSAPDMSHPAEAAAYARAVRQILRYAQVCDGNLEEGSLRCDCNVSIRPQGQKTLGTKVELKNLNSFRFIEKALEYEVHRQIDLLESGEEVVQETRLYDSTKNKTFSMRSKEEAEDYRYFPDPDLLPVKLDLEFISEIGRMLPELPSVKLERFICDYQLSQQDAMFLTEEVDVAQYFEQVASVCHLPKQAANWIMTELFRELNNNKLNVTQSHVSARQLGQLILKIEQGEISGKIAKKAFQLMWERKQSIDEVIEEQGWKQVSNDAEIIKWVDEVISKYPDQVAEFRAGKTKVMGFLMGQIMKLSKGQANPSVVQNCLQEKLK